MKYNSLLKLRFVDKLLIYVKARIMQRQDSKILFMEKSNKNVRIKELYIKICQYFKNNYCFVTFVIVCLVLFYLMNLTIGKLNKEQHANANNDNASIVRNKNLVIIQTSQLQHLAFIDKTIRKSRKDSDLIFRLNLIDKRVYQLNKHLIKYINSK